MNFKRFAYIIALICLIAGLWAFPAEALDEEEQPEQYFYRGRILSITDVTGDDAFSHAGIEQEVEVLLTSGPLDGQVVSVINYFIPGEPLFNIIIEEGKEVIVVAMGPKGSPDQFHLQDVARDRGVYYLVAILILMLLLIGKKQGFKTIITLAITGALIFRLLLPALLDGASPILMAIIVCSVAIMTTFLIIGGLSVKSLAAIIGTVSGVVTAGLMAIWAGRVASLTGHAEHEAQMLYYLDVTIDIRGLLFAGIIIGSMGAMTDIGMSVASAAAEIKKANPKISFKELTMGALNVGRDVMGTMANTLILAYVGAAMPLLMLVMAHQIEWLKVINLDMVATELIRGTAGTIGLIAAVPITALVSGLLMANRS